MRWSDACEPYFRITGTHQPFVVVATTQIDHPGLVSGRRRRDGPMFHGRGMARVRSVASTINYAFVALLFIVDQVFVVYSGHSGTARLETKEKLILAQARRADVGTTKKERGGKSWERASSTSERTARPVEPYFA